MFPSLRRRSYAIFIVVTGTCYSVAAFLYLLSILGEEQYSAEIVHSRYSEINLFQSDKRDQKQKQSIYVFEQSYVTLFPPGSRHEKASYFNKTTEVTRPEKGFAKYSFNESASSRLGFERTIPDNRPQKCFSLQYPAILPSASVIIIFHNEAWSTLLRTIHTVLARSPQAFLKEIILVDDFSDIEHEHVHLGSQLYQYLYSLPKVRLLRIPERKGIVAARLRGAELATGDVLVFLDSHCEANHGWLEPLLARIVEDEKHVVTPDIEIIDYKTFEYAQAHDPSIGVFTWQMLFKWRKMTAWEKQREINALPLRSPTMAGGLFAISKKFFYNLGAYDTGMSFWGGENLEISFRIWMCGGTIEIIPCSKVGHVFRDTMPYKTAKLTAEKNIKRVVDVWLDDYKAIVYSMKPKTFRSVRAGDTTERRKLREKLKCTSFTWYLQNVIPELRVPDMFPLGRGEVRSADSTMCLDTMGHNKVSGTLGMYMCHGMGSNQFFIYTKELKLWHPDELCAGKINARAGDTVEFYKCNTKGPQMNWEHTKNEFLRLQGYDLCMESGERTITLQLCTDTINQKWTFSSYPYYEEVQTKH